MIQRDLDQKLEHQWYAGRINQEGDLGKIVLQGLCQYYLFR